MHPFRQGSGRTQLIYVEKLAEQAGHKLDLTRLDRNSWMVASREVHFGRYDAISDCIAAAWPIQGKRTTDPHIRTHRFAGTTAVTYVFGLDIEKIGGPGRTNAIQLNQ